MIYREAVAAFVGGTLAPIGGHNLLEPAVWGKPVLFGPHTDHCAEVAALLTNAGGGLVVQNEAELAQVLHSLLRDPVARQRMGQAAQQVVADNQGPSAEARRSLRRSCRREKTRWREDARRRHRPWGGHRDRGADGAASGISLALDGRSIRACGSDSSLVL